MADQSLVTYVDVFPTEIIFKSNMVCLNTSVIPTLADPIILGLDFLALINFELRLDGELLTQRGSSSDTEGLHTLTDQTQIERNRTMPRKLEAPPLNLRPMSHHPRLDLG